MIRRLFVVLVFVPALVLVSTTAFAKGKKAASSSNEGPGTHAVKTANDTISGLLAKKVEAGSDEEKQLAAKVTTSVRSFLDVDELGARAMADHWSELTKEQKKQFLELLRGLIEDNYVKGLRQNLSYKVEYKGETAQDDGTHLVKTEIKTQRHGHPYTVKVDYVVVEKDGTWRAFDILTDGVGLVENYRAMFNKIIDKDGFDGLIAKMKKKRAS